LDVEKIDVQNGLNPRSRFDEDRLAELEASIRQDGLVTALTVAPAKGGYYTVIAGLLRRPRHSLQGSVYAMRYTMPMAKTVPVRELRSNLSSLLDDVSVRRDHVLVTRNGAPAAALVPIDEYEALEETAEILSDADALSVLEAGLAEIERGETITLAELRKELSERRPTAS